MMHLQMGEDEYSLLVNLKRLYEVQLTKDVASDGLFEDLTNTLSGLSDTGDEVWTKYFRSCVKDWFLIFPLMIMCPVIQVMAFLLLNMYLQVAWCLESIDSDNPNEASVLAVLSKRNTLFQHLERFLNSLSDVQGKGRNLLASRVRFR